jgi:hypothetical protein
MLMGKFKTLKYAAAPLLVVMATQVNVADAAAQPDAQQQAGVMIAGNSGDPSSLARGRHNSPRGADTAKANDVQAQARALIEAKPTQFKFALRHEEAGTVMQKLHSTEPAAQSKLLADAQTRAARLMGSKGM